MIITARKDARCTDPFPMGHNSFFSSRFSYWLSNNIFPCILSLVEDQSENQQLDRPRDFLCLNNSGLLASKTRQVNISHRTQRSSSFFSLAGGLRSPHSPIILINALCSNEENSELPCVLSFAEKSQSQCITQRFLELLCAGDG